MAHNHNSCCNCHTKPVMCDARKIHPRLDCARKIRRSDSETMIYLKKGSSCGDGIILRCCGSCKEKICNLADKELLSALGIRVMFVPELKGFDRPEHWRDDGILFLKDDAKDAYTLEMAERCNAEHNKGERDG